MLAVITKWTQRLGSRWQSMSILTRFAMPIIYLEWASWVGFVATRAVGPNSADSTADWLVASAVRDGISPFTDLRTLSAHYATPYLSPGWSQAGDAAWVHPRTPGALLLLQPVTTLQPAVLRAVVIVASLLALGVLGYFVLPRLTMWSKSATLLLATLLVTSGPILRNLQFGAWSAVLTLLIAATWVGVRKSDSPVAGLGLGVAIALRFFPALLLVPLLLARRFKAAASSAVTAALLTLLGMTIYRISPQELLDGLSKAGNTWFEMGANASLSSPAHTWLGLEPLVTTVLVSAGGVLLIWWASRLDDRVDVMLALGTVTMLLASPLSWEHYDVMLLPAVALMASRKSSAPNPAFAWAWVALMTLGFFLRQPWERADVLSSGPPSLTGRVLLLVGLVFAVGRRLRRHRRVSPPLLAET